GRAPSLPLSGYSTVSGTRFAESSITVPGPRSWCAPSGPTGKQVTSPRRSSRSPSRVRRVGVPSTTISHSSVPWWKWYGQVRSPSGSSKSEIPIGAEPSLRPIHAACQRKPSRSDDWSSSSAKTFVLRNDAGAQPPAERVQALAVLERDRDQRRHQRGVAKEEEHVREV